MTPPDLSIDITQEVCPMTYVRVKLALERLVSGQTLEVVMSGDEPWRNVPRSVVEDGHEVLSGAPPGRLLVRKGPSSLPARAGTYVE